MSEFADWQNTPKPLTLSAETQAKFARIKAVAPSVDVEKLRELAASWEALSGSPTPYPVARTLRDCARSVLALLDSTPSVDYGRAEIQYGVRCPSGYVSEQDGSGFQYDRERAERTARENNSTVSTTEYEAVTCEQRRTPWRPVDGAPGEDSQAAHGWEVSESDRVALMGLDQVSETDDVDGEPLLPPGEDSQR